MGILKANSVKQITITAALLLICGMTAFAQSTKTVTIKFDNADGITGELIEAKDDAVRLNTLMGAVTIPFAGVTCIGSACPGAISRNVEQAPVVLSALDGSLQMFGNLLGIVDGQYVLATDLGDFRIETTRVNCEGEACSALLASSGG